MRKVFVLPVVFIFIVTYSHGQSYLLHSGQKSSTLPFLFASEAGIDQFYSGYIYSQNGKFDAGASIGYLAGAQLFAASPFYRYYFYNDPSPSGVAFASSVSYNLLVDQNGNTGHSATFSPSLYYRIPTSKVIIVPEFDVFYARNLQFDASQTFYNIASSFAFVTKSGYTTFKPAYQFSGDGGGIFYIGLNFQWVKETE